MKIVAIIPVRMAATRFPGKPLESILGLPMVEHVRRRLLLSKYLDDVIVATCDKEIRNVILSYRGEVMMTSKKHKMASDRVNEVAKKIDCSHIINIQGDEALVKPQHIDAAVTMMLENPTINVGILVNKYFKENNPSDIKVVLNERSEVMYFSRNDIPSTQRNKKAQRLKAYHVVPFRKKFLLKYTQWEPTALERIEFNEYLRILEKGFTIKATEVSSSAISVDTPQDLAFVRKRMPEDSDFKKYRIQSK